MPIYKSWWPLLSPDYEEGKWDHRIELTELIPPSSDSAKNSEFFWGSSYWTMPSNVFTPLWNFCGQSMFKTETGNFLSSPFEENQNILKSSNEVFSTVQATKILGSYCLTIDKFMLDFFVSFSFQPMNLVKTFFPARDLCYQFFPHVGACTFSVGTILTFCIASKINWLKISFNFSL